MCCSFLKSNARANESSPEFVSCLFAKFQSSLSSRLSDAKPLFVYERIQSRFFKSILTKNLGKFREACWHTAESQHLPMYNDNVEPPEPVVVLNFNTIVWSSISLILALILFTSLLSVLVLKLYRSSRRSRHATKSSFSPPLIVSKKKELYVTTREPPTVPNASPSTSIFNSLRKKINYFVSYLIRKPKVVYQQANLQVKLPKEQQQFCKAPITISKPGSPHYYGPCNVYSNSKLYSQPNSRSDSLTSATSSNSQSGSSNRSSNGGSQQDLFIVYNKLDSDLVHNIITPILKGKSFQID